MLCEKAFALNASEAREILEAAAAKNVFIMEAMWTRFHPLIASLQHVLYNEKAIGDVHRVFCDFSLDMDIPSLPNSSRLKDPAMGAGSLLDIGIYAVTWGLLTLCEPGTVENLQITATQTLRDGIDIASSVFLVSPKTGRQGILTSSIEVKTPKNFCRIEGTEGHILLCGSTASMPESFTVYPNVTTGNLTEDKRYEFEIEGKGFYFEADAVAISISRGLLENEVMAHAETMRVLEILDAIRRQGGATFPQER